MFHLLVTCKSRYFYLYNIYVKSIIKEVKHHV
nr:MAG TPA: hypothetical protein [Caudoviricetes sp.]